MNSLEKLEAGTVFPSLTPFYKFITLKVEVMRKWESVHKYSVKARLSFAGMSNVWCDAFPKLIFMTT